MPRCTFCKQIYEFPHGMTIILNDGNILYFCSSKCRKNQMKLKRDNKKVNWVRKSDITETEAYVPASMKKEAKVEVKEEKHTEKPVEKKEEHKEHKKEEKVAEKKA